MIEIPGRKLLFYFRTVSLTWLCKRLTVWWAGFNCQCSNITCTNGSELLVFIAWLWPVAVLKWKWQLWKPAHCIASTLLMVEFPNQRRSKMSHSFSQNLWAFAWPYDYGVADPGWRQSSINKNKSSPQQSNETECNFWARVCLCVNPICPSPIPIRILKLLKHFVCREVVAPLYNM